MKVQSYFREGGDFIPVEHFTGTINDPDYIEGAIELVVGRRKLLSIEMWDYVDQLWAYILDGLLELNQKGRFTTYFPDQPIKLEFVTDGEDSVIVKVKVNEERIAVVSRNEFYREIVQAARTFFEALTRVLSAKQDEFLVAFSKIQALERLTISS